ncbi:putative quinol monooxygenase [Pseudarthrobacter raffinosi]|uniref:putative quinol monooxygenase n=1 Tax=Pseudarthrobacter raffinosi TaxID=2953651 RepID=UPI00208F64B2|nr:MULTISPECIES: putative quinol monooxygenase [unclassified Pseudarthrobacter]MCO4252006.1 antibiotic biosynthesis monooxygenase [Pseudarthrobacter sp. MDT3-9]MCO4262848.1 antibiotic biosynthesis monooxygenase [Pseudarthrobacter sp. MDT3-26]
MTAATTGSPTSGPVHLIPIFVAEQGSADELKRLLTVLQNASRLDPGCLEYSVFGDEQDPDTFLLCEKWTSSEALDAHNEQPHVVDFVESAAQFMAEPLRVHRLRPIA